MYEVIYNDNDGYNSISFNLCDKNARQCSDRAYDYANIINTNNTCSHMTPILNKKEKNKPGSYSMVNEKYPTEGIQLTYTGGNKCAQNDTYSLLVTLNCN